MRDEAPLYWNNKYEFFALSRWDDVDAAMLDWKTYISGRGSVLEMIRANIDMPPGIILMEDPPIHDLHRSLLSRVFTPKKMKAIEPKVRAYCAEVLDPLVGTGGFDFIEDLGAFMPMRTIGMLLGIPEADQEAMRQRIDEGLRLEEGAEPKPTSTPSTTPRCSASTSTGGPATLRRPDDRVVDGEFEDETGTVRALTRARSSSTRACWPERATRRRHD